MADSLVFSSKVTRVEAVKIMEVIISHCELYVLLQLRMVSKSTKALVDASARLKDVLEEVKIKLHASTLQAFVSTAPPLPFSNFEIRGSAVDVEKFYNQTPQLEEFMRKFCPGIRKLHLSKMLCGTRDSELKFFLTLRNLRELEIDFWIPLSPETNELEDGDGYQMVVPSTGDNGMLKILKINYIEKYYPEEYLVKWIKKMPSIQVLKIPKPTAWGNLGHLKHIQRLDMNLSGDKMLVEEWSEEDIRCFKEMVSIKKVHLEMVGCSFLRSVLDARIFSTETKKDFKGCIVSFEGVSEILKEERFRNLTELSLWACPYDKIEWSFNLRKIQLPGLRKIKAWIMPEKEDAEKIQDILECIFRPNEPRLSVTELDLDVDVWSGDQETVSLIFQSHYLDLSFPNLTHLTIEPINFSRRELCRLIEVISRKSLLEELSLATSGEIPEEAFLDGDSAETLTFLKLKNLKKLRLDSGRNEERECEKMGNQMLEMFSKMCLTHLQIIGGGWNEVTSGGIRSLFEGPFGRSVLWVRLECLEGSKSQPGKHSICLDILARVAYMNRVDRGLTSTSFEQFKASQEAPDMQSFRDSGWIA